MLELESALTDRYQTTVPSAVRRALKLRKRDRIVYRLRADGTVLIERKPARARRDPVLDRFLAFLTRDMSEHPERLRTIDAPLRKRIRLLTKGVAVDLDARLPPDEE